LIKQRPKAIDASAISTFFSDTLPGIATVRAAGCAREGLRERERREGRRLGDGREVVREAEGESLLGQHACV